MSPRALVGMVLAVALATAAAAEEPPARLLVDLTASHAFGAGPAPVDGATALPGLATRAEFEALPAADRFVYDFETWTAGQDRLGLSVCDFRLRLGSPSLAETTLNLRADGPWPANHLLTRAAGAGGQGHVLTGLGNIGWGSMQTHTFRFERPLRAFGLVYRSREPFVLQRFFWANASQNGAAVSYTLSDGTVVNLGGKGQPSGRLAADTDHFVGLVDASGRGITSVTISVKGTGKGDQAITLDDLALAVLPRPAVAPVANLRASHAFFREGQVTSRPAQALPGLDSLADFQAIAGSHRFVYDFGTWPQAGDDLGGASASFAFDTRGRGQVERRLTVTASARGPVRLTRRLLTDGDGAPVPVLDGLGDIGRDGWAEQTFCFDQPVKAFGAVYRSAGDFALARAGQPPLSYVLANGTVVDLDAATGLGSPKPLPAGLVSGGSRTFVGVSDPTGVGIAAVTVRQRGSAPGAQPIYLEALGFGLDGLPPGDWKLTWSDEFDGDRLDKTKWGTGYRFVDIINHELQGYVPENVVVADGACTLKVEKRPCRNVDQYGHQGASQAYASGAITTYEKFAQRYGYFEARVKMTAAPGTWPAFWLLPDRGAGVAKLDDRVGTGLRAGSFGSEIDIFEFMPWWKTADGLFLSHSGCIWSYGPVTEKDPAPHAHGGYALDNNGYGPELLKYPAATTAFHTYGLYWAPGKLVFYIDSKPVYYVDDAQHVPNTPEYILLNCALSRNGWGMGPDKKDPTLEQLDAGLPSAMVIDWVRVYEGALGN